MTIPTAAIADALERAGVLGGGRRGNVPATVTGITDDSRQIPHGGVFVAVRGAERDGHDFLAAAAAGGATLAIVEDPSRTELPALVVREGTSRRAAAIAAAAAYGEPARALRLVGVTGTNGKTTTVGMIRHLLDEPGTLRARAASIGTLGVLVGSAGEPLPGGSGLTTPGAVELQRVFRALVDAGVRTVAMEVSSHSLHQHRVEGVRFDAAVFTNLTRDHLDYHGSMGEYLAAKGRLLEHLAPDGTAVVNADDPAWSALGLPARRLTFGIRSGESDVRASGVKYALGGSRWRLEARGEIAPVALPLIGDFNIANALGAAATGVALGMPAGVIAQRLSALPQVPGRLEILAERPTVLRDYAHTPDALARALAAVRPFVAEGGRLLLVFGCGGDRDRGKRPEMGAIAERGADVTIVTSDNPRTEDPERILDDIEAGMRAPHERVEDRREAIARALAVAGPDDVVLLAGKGHETYQIRGTTKHPFDEKEIVHALVAARGPGRAP